MDKYVFLKVLENQEQVMIDPEYVLYFTIFITCRYLSIFYKHKFIVILLIKFRCTWVYTSQYYCIS